jgi:nitrite reductase/ring-hydroxylating ferredoxin subunit
MLAARPAEHVQRGQRGLDAETVARWTTAVEAERTRADPPRDFPTLPELPAGRYTDPAFFALEREALFKRGWVYAGQTDQLPAAGSWFQRRVTGVALLVVRGEDGQVRAFYNTCRHRGAPVAREESGCARNASFTCGYHGWTYALDGRLKSIIDRRDFGAADLECRNLVPVRCETYGSFVFVCEDPEAEPLARFLAPVSRFFDHLPMGELKLVYRRTVELAGNYKVVLENFLEAYHFRMLHQHTVHRIYDGRGTHVHLWDHGHSMMLTPNRRADWRDPGAVGMPEMARATSIERDYNPSYNVFPNLIVPINASGIPCVAIWPVDIGRSQIEVFWVAPGWGDGPRPALWDTRIANFDRIVDEDVSFVEPIQASLGSRGFTGVPLNYQERRIYHWNEELDRRIGVDRIPPQLRVAPVLGRYVERD